MNAKSEKLIAWLLFGGISAVIIGGILFWMFMAGGALALQASAGKNANELALSGVGAILFLGGVGSIIFGLITGFRVNGKISGTGSGSGGFRQVPTCRIQSRFAINAVGEMIFNDFEYDAPGGKLYVQVQFPDGHVEELTTAWAVFCQCGEGMTGAALVRGGWLGSFSPIIQRADQLQSPHFDRVER